MCILGQFQPRIHARPHALFSKAKQWGADFRGLYLARRFTAGLPIAVPGVLPKADIILIIHIESEIARLFGNLRVCYLNYQMFFDILAKQRKTDVEILMKKLQQH